MKVSVRRVNGATHVPAEFPLEQDTYERGNAKVLRESQRLENIVANAPRMVCASPACGKRAATHNDWSKRCVAPLSLRFGDVEWLAAGGCEAQGLGCQ
jgi:hypothetical protein